MCDIAIYSLVEWKWFQFEFQWEGILMEIDADIQRQENIESASKSLGRNNHFFLSTRGGVATPVDIEHDSSIE
jgi:hypothetical protein